MKKIFVFCLTAISISAFAGEGVSSNSNTESASQAAALNQGNHQDITFTSPDVTHSYQQIGGTETIKNVPNPSAPALTTSNDTCMGSTSGSITIAGLGLGGGSTWTDTNCKHLKNSRELWNMGMRAAALALLCMDDDNKEALEQTGFVCPVRKNDKSATTAVVGNTLSPAHPVAGH